jgi:hypothetical protein
MTKCNCGHDKCWHGTKGCYKQMCSCEKFLKREMVDVICEWCKKSFQKTQYEVNRTKHHLCSLSCAQRYGPWKGGNSRGRFEIIYRPIRKSMVQQCSTCGSTTDLCIHHLDGNYKNNALSNLTIVCRGCHTRIHQEERKQAREGEKGLTAQKGALSLLSPAESPRKPELSEKDLTDMALWDTDEADKVIEARKRKR